MGFKPTKWLLTKWFLVKYIKKKKTFKRLKKTLLNHKNLKGQKNVILKTEANFLKCTILMKI